MLQYMCNHNIAR